MKQNRQLRYNSYPKHCKLSLLQISTILFINKNINKRMIQQQSSQPESIICADFDLLFRLIKTQEQCYLSLNEVVSSVLHGRSQIEENIFVHDLIHKYRQLIQSHTSKSEQHQQEQRTLLQKHPQQVMASDKINTFLKRACFRVLEVIFITINQVGLKASTLYQKFLRFKGICQKIIFENSEDKSFQLIKQIFEFSQHKYSALIKCLKNITDSLQNGKIQEIDKLRENWPDSIPANDTNASKQNHFKSLFKGRVKLLEKRQQAKEEAKALDRVTNHKKAKKVMDCYKDVMDFNRQDFLEDFIGCCHQSKEKAIKQLLNRNNKNKKTINEFIEKKPHKRRRKLSEAPAADEQKCRLFEDRSNLIKNRNTSSENNKQSLLLKFKENQYRQRTLTSQYYKKVSKGEFRSRNEKRMATNTQYSDRYQQGAIIKAIEDIICENEELQVKVNEAKTEERLPLLNKRAISVDKQYRGIQNELSRISVSKNISRSVKQGSSRIKRGKLEKSDVFNYKLKSSGSIVYQDLSHKLIHINDLNKQVCF